MKKEDDDEEDDDATDEGDGEGGGDDIFFSLLKRLMKALVQPRLFNWLSSFSSNVIVFSRRSFSASAADKAAA